MSDTAPEVTPEMVPHGRQGSAVTTLDPPSTLAPAQPEVARSSLATIARRAALATLVIVGVALLVVGMVPQTAWQASGYGTDDPLPPALLPLTTALFYTIPALIGLLCRRWQVALVLATAPAWLDLGIFSVAAAGQLGPFYLVQSHPDGAVGTLELYAALGLAGWIVRAAAIRIVHSPRG